MASRIGWLVVPYLVMTAGLLGWYVYRSPAQEDPSHIIDVYYEWLSHSGRDLEKISRQLFGCSPTADIPTPEDHLHVRNHLESLGLHFAAVSWITVPATELDSQWMTFQMTSTVQEHIRFIGYCHSVNQTVNPNITFSCLPEVQTAFYQRWTIFGKPCEVRESQDWDGFPEEELRLRPQYVTKVSIGAEIDDPYIGLGGWRYGHLWEYNGRLWPILLLLPVLPVLLIWLLKKPLSRILALPTLLSKP